MPIAPAVPASFTVTWLDCQWLETLHVGIFRSLLPSTPAIYKILQPEYKLFTLFLLLKEKKKGRRLAVGMDSRHLCRLLHSAPGTDSSTLQDGGLMLNFYDSWAVVAEKIEAVLARHPGLSYLSHPIPCWVPPSPQPPRMGGGGGRKGEIKRGRGGSGRETETKRER